MKTTIPVTITTVRPATQEDIEGAYAGDSGIKVGDEIDDEQSYELPAKWEICHRCKGEGSHVNPSIDGHGISMEEWNGPDWDDESRDMYMSGGYDVACEAGCNGGKVLVADEALCNDEPRRSILAAWNKQQEEKMRMDDEDRRTRNAENGYLEGFNY